MAISVNFMVRLPMASNLHRNYAQGSDGKIGNHFVEVKTITPFKKNDTIILNLKRNFSKVLIVKIDAGFEVQSRLVDRKALPKVKGDNLKINWSDFASESLGSTIGQR